MPVAARVRLAFMATLPQTEPFVLDVRPILARGQDPFTAIMAAKERLDPEQSLRLIAPFEPQPLFEVFAADGYTVCSQRVADDEWHIVFTPGGGENDKPREVDARALEPPGPLQAALQAVAELGRGETLILRTRFRPVHLFEELDGEGFDWETEEAAPQHWITHIWRVTAN